MKEQSIQISEKTQRALVLLGLIAGGVSLVIAGTSGYEATRLWGEQIAQVQIIVGGVMASFSFAALMR